MVSGSFSAGSHPSTAIVGAENGLHAICDDLLGVLGGIFEHPDEPVEPRSRRRPQPVIGRSFQRS